MNILIKLDTIVTLIFFGISMVFLIFYYKNCYKQNTKEIGIYLSLGAKSKNIIFSYTIQGLILTIFSLIISIPFSLLYLNFINSTFEIFIFTLEIQNFLISFGFGVSILAIINTIAYIYYKKKMPIEIIKKY